MRCDLEYKLGIAREFLHEPRFYFPHSVDFRGRAYPMHPHLNHLGSDVCRGLLHFAEARRLGADGLRWLHIQVPNRPQPGALVSAPSGEAGTHRTPYCFREVSCVQARRPFPPLS